MKSISVLRLTYSRLIKRWPSLATAWRWIAHREHKPPFRRRFAESSELHIGLKNELAHIKNGIFFEAGANDGILFSCTAYLERYLGWKGLLVEAVPHKFVECVRNRPGSIVEHCGLVGVDFNEPFVEIIYAGLMSIAPQISSETAEAHQEIGGGFLLGTEQKIAGQIFAAPARTLEQVLKKHALRRIDLMVLDLEGAEIEVLRSVDFGEYQIQRILLETRDRQASDQFLGERGYLPVAQFGHRDVLYSLSHSPDGDFSCPSQSSAISC